MYLIEIVIKIIKKKFFFIYLAFKHNNKVKVSKL